MEYVTIPDIGIIKACDKYLLICKYDCCKFTNNYILLYPGEYEKSKENKNHIKIIDDNYFGGKKAICFHICKKDDFKPLDCRSYPYFPIINENGKLEIIKGKKCPLTENDLLDHKKQFTNIWNKIIENEEILEWLKKVELIGYKTIA